jgi:hypothetical protein
MRISEERYSTANPLTAIPSIPIRATRVPMPAFPTVCEIYGRLSNFLNQKYEEVLGYPALRLTFMAGMKFSFPAE